MDNLTWGRRLFYTERVCLHLLAVCCSGAAFSDSAMEECKIVEQSPRSCAESVPDLTFAAELRAIEAEELALTLEGVSQESVERKQTLEDRQRRILRENKLFALCAFYSRGEHYGVTVGVIEFMSLTKCTVYLGL